MEIADVEAALEKVRAFIALLEASQQIWNSGGPQNLQWAQTENLIHERLPLVVRIAARADPALGTKLQKGIDEESYGWPYVRAAEAARQLAGLLGTMEEAEQILGPVGPKLAAANMHPWIWNAAVNLWDNGHRREAVQAAAQALFDNHLPAKLGVPARSAKDLVAQALSTDAPTAGNSRLRLDDYADRSQNWTSQHEGARFFGMGCAQLIRNLATHVGTQPDEQTALEQLASLSLLARLIDRAKVTV